MSFAVCSVPVAPLRKDAAHRSEMVSQLLFGEFVQVLSQDGDFVRVICLYDNYEGWCQQSQLWPTSEAEVVETETYCGGFQAEVLLDGRSASIPFAAPLYYPGQDFFTIGHHRVDYRNTTRDAITVERAPSTEHLRAVAFRYLNTGYLWGGKSVFGTDCSGFVQQVFKLCGTRLPRDAYQQAASGAIVNAVKDTRTGDLAFFHNEEGKVTHVGILLEDFQIIHASGRVRVDLLNDDGIINSESLQTHKLHAIRRHY